jgi:hypothetical protein
VLGILHLKLDLDAFQDYLAAALAGGGSNLLIDLLMKNAK